MPNHPLELINWMATNFFDDTILSESQAKVLIATMVFDLTREQAGEILEMSSAQVRQYRHKIGKALGKDPTILIQLNLLYTFPLDGSHGKQDTAGVEVPS